MRARLLALIGLLLGLGAAGCGERAKPPPDVRTPLLPVGSRKVILGAGEVRFRGPVNWTDVVPRPPRLGGIESRRAILAVWRYPRTEPLPQGRAQLARVGDLLLAEVRRRDPTFALEEGPRLTRRAGAPAIELAGSQTIAGVRVRVRSSHVFGHGAEVVLDAYAPPERFETLDRFVFEPALRTLELRAPQS